MVIVILLFVLVFACGIKKEKNKGMSIDVQTYATVGSVERIDPSIDELIPKNAVIEVLDSGHVWTEGPVWIDEGNYLLFSDIPPNSIFKWSEEDGASLYLKPSGYTGTKKRGGEPGSNGLLRDRQGNLILCQHGDRKIARMSAPIDDPKPEFETIVDNYQGSRFNSPNDAVFDRQGNLYFTDPPYGLEQRMDDPLKELDFQGVYRYSKEGTLSLLTDKMTRPNGIGLSPDESTLYVANSDPDMPIWNAYTLNDEGEVTGERLFHDATGYTGKGLPDGLKVDEKGNVWATGPGGVLVISADGQLLGRILTGQATSNCGFDTDQNTLYMTCDDYLARIKL